MKRILTAICSLLLIGQVALGQTSVIPRPLSVELSSVLPHTPDLNKVKCVIDQRVKGNEAYELNITNDEVVVRASSQVGLFYGMQTLRQQIASGKVYAGIIKDSPRFAWRGFMLDESRHFFGMEKVKQLLDIMAYYKLNKFHWHLTDSPGWRIEIKAYPELTRAGAIGNHSNPEAPASYYTQEQIREIVSYAAVRHIEVIPEIDMPGHATASNRSYPVYSGGGSKSHPDFTFNPGKEDTYVYLGNILKEVSALFPSKYLHIGGDEVSFGSEGWKTNADVQLLMQREGLNDLKQVEAYFIHRMAKNVHELEKTLIGWDDMLDCNIPSANNIVMWWRHDKPQRLQQALDKGFNVILCPRRPLYFDFIQHNTHKVGRVWNGFCPLEDVYAFPTMQNAQVLGIQANVWTEVISTSERLDFMTFPRLIAVAESAWTMPEQKDYDDFCLRLEQAYQYLDNLHIFYFDHRSPARHAEPSGPQNKSMGDFKD